MVVASQTGTEMGPWSAELERRVLEFETAWREGRNPDLGSFLPADDTGRAVCLVELVHTDLEYRLQGDAGTRIEPYLERFPELRNPDRVVDLIAAEYELRCRKVGPTLEEYLQRFPEYRLDLLRRFRTSALGDTPRGGSLPALRARSGRRRVSGAGCDAAGPPLATTPAAPAPPNRLGKYDLQEKLGRGGFGTVYRAWDGELHRAVAVKIPHGSGLSTDADRQRLLREARHAARLKHPGIVALYEAGQVDNVCYLVYELVPGMTLNEWWTGRPLAARTAAGLILPVAKALHYAHQQGVVHRDIKPSNILLQIEPAAPQPGAATVPPLPSILPKITDFGLAKRETGDSIMVEGLVGTPAYMSPEQAGGDGRQVDVRSDVYSLGVVLYQLLTGELPFRGEGHRLLAQILDQEPPPPRRLKDGIPRDLENICLKAMSKQPRDRYRSAAELAAELRSFLDNRPVLARPVSNLVRCWRWCRRKPLTAVLLAALAAAIGLGLAGMGWQWRRVEGQRQQALEQYLLAKEAKQQADQQRQQAETNLKVAARALDTLWKQRQRFVEELPFAAGGGRESPESLETYKELLQLIQPQSDSAAASPAPDPSANTGALFAKLVRPSSHFNRTHTAEPPRAVSVEERLLQAPLDPPEAALAALHTLEGRQLQKTLDTRTPAYRSMVPAAYEKAIALWSKLLEQRPTNLQTEIQWRFTLADCYAQLGAEQVRTDEHDKALANLERGRTMFATLRQAHADFREQGTWRGPWALHFDLDRKLAFCDLQRGEGLQRSGRLEEALQAVQAACGGLASLVPTYPLYTEECAQEWADGCVQLGELQGRAGEPQQAFRSFRQAQEALRLVVARLVGIAGTRMEWNTRLLAGDRGAWAATVDQSPQMAPGLIDLAKLRRKTGALLRTHENLRRHLQRLVDGAPANDAYRAALAESFFSAALLHKQLGQPVPARTLESFNWRNDAAPGPDRDAAALNSCRIACELDEQVLTGNPNDRAACRRLARSCHTLALLQRQAGHQGAALRSCARAVELYQRDLTGETPLPGAGASSPDHAPGSSYLEAAAAGWELLAILQQEHGLSGEACRSDEQAMALYRQLDNPQCWARALCHSADALAALGRRDQAIARLQQAIEHYDFYPLVERKHVCDNCWLRLARLHRDLGRWDEAAAAIKEYQNAWPPRHYEAAREFALCAAAVLTRKQSVTSEVETQRRRFTDLAVAELRELLKSGSKNLAWLRWDPSLTALRTDARFLQLVQE